MAIMVTKKPPAYLREARVKAGYVSRGTASIAVPYSPETIGRHERGDFEEALRFLRQLEASINDIILIGLGKREGTSRQMPEREVPDN